MKFVKLTRRTNNSNYYVNPQHIVAVGYTNQGGCLITTTANGDDGPHQAHVSEELEDVVAALEASMGG